MAIQNKEEFRKLLETQKFEVEVINAFFKRNKIPSMSSINKLLLNENVQKYAWEKLSIDKNVIFPSFSERIIYGELSEMIHRPELNMLYMSDIEFTSIQDFFKCLCNVKFEL